MNFPDRKDGSEASSNAEQVIEQLHAELSPQLLRLGWAVVRDWDLAADAVQEAFRVFAEKYPTIPVDQHRGWLHTTVQYQALNIRRGRLRNDAHTDRLKEQSTGYRVDSPAQRSEQTEQIESLRAAIDQLPSEQRQIVMLRLGEEKSFAAIASELKLPLGTVLSRMRLALAKIRSSLKPDDSLQ